MDVPGAPNPDKVRDAISKHGVSKAELARRSGVHPNTLANVEKAGWSPRWDTLVALCDAVDAILADRA